MRQATNWAVSTRWGRQHQAGVKKTRAERGATCPNENDSETNKPWTGCQPWGFKRAALSGFVASFADENSREVCFWHENGVHALTSFWIVFTFNLPCNGNALINLKKQQFTLPAGCGAQSPSMLSLSILTKGSPSRILNNSHTLIQRHGHVLQS